MPLKPNHINPAPAASPEPDSAAAAAAASAPGRKAAGGGGARPNAATGKHSAFRFKQFAVTQQHAAMKVGTDGVLLGAWVSLDPEKEATPLHRILDIGTGTGVIALMLAQRTATLPETQGNTMSMIDAVEVEPAAAEEAALNFAASPWAGRLAAHTMPIQQYAADYAGEKYDLIVSNPPYFMAGTDFRRGFDTSETATPPSAERIAARHAEQLPYDQLIDAVLLLLEPAHGRFAAIFPYREAGIFIAKAAAKGLFATRMLDIHGAPHKPVKRVAAEFSLRRPGKKEDIVRATLCIEDGAGNFTDAYRELTRDFYLKF